jgi:hypothetical protein
MYKAIINFFAIICFVSATLFLLPALNVNMGTRINDVMSAHALAQVVNGLPTIPPVPSPPFPIPSFPWFGGRPTATPVPTPRPSVTPIPAITPIPTGTPMPTVVPTAIPTVVPTLAPSPVSGATVPPVTVTITPVPVATATISPGPAGGTGNVTFAPMAGNVSATPNATGVTELVRSNAWAFVAIVILALMLIAVAAWDLWKGSKKK